MKNTQENFAAKLAVQMTPAAKALDAAMPGAGPRRLARELFQGKVEHGRVSRWRTGKRNLPAWALEMIRAAAERRIADIRASVEMAKPGPGTGPYIIAWNARRARERDELKKKEGLG